jgi:hypothetical protein
VRSARLWSRDLTCAQPRLETRLGANSIVLCQSLRSYRTSFCIFIALCEEAGLDGIQFSTQRAAWSRAVRNALPELEPNREDSTLRGLLNRSHEELLQAEKYWHQYGQDAGLARLGEALAMCQYVVKSLSDFRSRKHVGPYTSGSGEDAEKSRAYWGLGVAGGSTVPREQ